MTAAAGPPPGSAGEQPHDAEARRARDEQYRLIVASARDYAILTTHVDGIIDSWSAGAEATFGWSEAEIIGQSIAVTFVPSDREAGIPEAEREVARRDGLAPDVRWHLRKDGGRVFVEGTTRALRDDAGRLLGFLKIGQDVTRRRETEQELRTSELRFRAVANFVPDLLWQSEPGGSVVWCNDRWYAYTGQTRLEARGMGWIDAIHPDDRLRGRAAYLQAIAEHVPYESEHRIRAADGSYRWFLLRAEPVRDAAGQVTGWFGTATDVHEQRAALDAVERRVGERVRELAAANVALEEVAQQRTALRRLLAFAEESERRRLARELHDQLGQHLTALALGIAEVRRLLGAGQPPTARLAQLDELTQLMSRDVRYLALELRPPELDDVGFESALQTYVERWRERYGIEADLAITGRAAAVPLSSEAGTALYRIAQEALTNVAKHAEATQVSVLVDRPNGIVRLVIEDNGRGFAPEAAAKRAREAGRLGLAGMRERAAVLGGTVEIESSPGVGTTVYARLPLHGGRGEGTATSEDS